MRLIRIAAAALLAAGLSGCAPVATTAAPAKPPRPAEGERIAVWPGVAPGAEGLTQQEVVTVDPKGEHLVRNVTAASMQAYWPDPAIATGAAMIVAPGGGFRFLTMDSEGEQVARWLNRQGVAAFVLRYRLMETPATDQEFAAKLMTLLAPLFGPTIVQEMNRLAPPAIADGIQALNLVRSHAADWGLKPGQLGMIGFSAGAVVTLGVTLQANAADRPAYAAAIYPGPWKVDPVPADAPPLFVAAARDDMLTALATPPIVKAWTAAGRPIEQKIYANGNHGFGMKKQGTASDRWTEDFRAWLQAQGVVGSGC